MSRSPTPPGTKRGLLMAIGGAEDKTKERRILRYFLSAAGGPEARLVIFPTASEQHDSGETYARLFAALDADETFVADLRDRESALRREDEIVTVLDGATGVFFVGGNQLRLTNVLGGTKILRTLRRRHAEGVIIGGTSAGAALLCEHMIAFGDSGPTPCHGRVALVPGMGLINKVIIDQHFRQRDRVGRLLTALSYNPFPIGVGVDENTAMVIDGNDLLHVVGQRSVTVIDAHRCSWTNSDAVVNHQPIAIFGTTMHVLTEGCTFDLVARVPKQPAPVVNNQGELASVTAGR